MSKNESVKSRLARWLEIDEILPFLYGGFRQHEKLANDKDNMTFRNEKSLSLGIGMMRVFHMI